MIATPSTTQYSGDDDERISDDWKLWVGVCFAYMLAFLIAALYATVYHDSANYVAPIATAIVAVVGASFQSKNGKIVAAVAGFVGSISILAFLSIVRDWQDDWKLNLATTAFGFVVAVIAWITVSLTGTSIRRRTLSALLAVFVVVTYAGVDLGNAMHDHDCADDRPNKPSYC